MLTDQGKIGVGTKTPTEKMDIDGNIKLLSASDRGIILERFSGVPLHQ